MRPWAALLLALGGPAAAQTAAVSTAPVIAEIKIEHVNVFDLSVPGENWWPFRMANKIHITTREDTIRRELLLGTGDSWDALKALESERNLRQLNIFRRVDIRPEPRTDGRADLLARTQDSWTLNIKAGASTEGGQTSFSYGLNEDNLLGTGKSATVAHSESGDLKRTDFRYSDSRFLSTRYALNPFYAFTPRGDSVGTDLIRPFFSLDTPYGVGANWSHTIDESILYRNGVEYSKFLLKTDNVFATYGRRLGADDAFVQRLEAGYYFQKDQFYPLNLIDTVPGTLPKDRRMSGPAVGYSWVQPRYVKETYINKMERVEDFNMGNEFQIFAGYAAQAFGSDRDRFFFNALDQHGFYLMPGRFFLAQVGAKGRALNGKPDNTLVFANFNLFWKSERPFAQTLVGHAEVNKGRALDGENQILLGGNNGLRGYKNFSFTGSESVLVNLEDRFFIPGEHFHLVRFGGAVFFDSGAVAPAGAGLTWKNYYSDVGLGLRVSPTRSQSGNVVRLDLARSLQRGPGPDRWVVSITGRQAFQIFNSSTKTLRESPASKLIVAPQN